MYGRLAAIAALPLLAAACGGTVEAGSTSAPAPPPATTSTAPPPPATTTPAETSVVAYFLRDGLVAPVRIRVPATRAVGAAALKALFDGPPAGYETAIPAGAQLRSLAIDGGVATATVSDELRGADAVAQAQIVYTLTQFPSVGGVGLRLADAPLPLTGDGGEPLTEPATRSDYEQETPRILVESPLPGDEVASPLRVTGTSNDYEATFQLQLVQGENELVDTFVTATSGTGVRGTFDKTVEFDGRGDATLVAFERSASDEGPPELGRVEIPLVLR
jgi:hypothetical protein